MKYEARIARRSVALNARNLREALARIAQATGIGAQLTDEGTVALAVDFAPIDKRASAVELAFATDHLSLSADAEDGTLVRWLCQELARHLDGTVSLPPTASNDEIVRSEAVRSLLRARESTRTPRTTTTAREPSHEGDELMTALLALIDAGRIEVRAEAGAALSALTRQPESLESLYEALIESDWVEDIFLGETEFVAEIRRRITPR